MNPQNSLPGLQHVDHVSLTVTDMDAASAFYCSTFGGIELYRLGPFDAREFPRQPDGRDWTLAYQNVADARFQIAMLALGPNLMLELFSFTRPDDRATHLPRNCDPGFGHIAFKVRDLDAAIEFLRQRGLPLMEGPIVISDGPCAGLRVQYFLDPFGNQLELVEYGHLLFMDATTAALYARNR
ncbi:glyoxylase I family protein [Kerstersia gyiorum]|uniref:Glyoxylase I family protein n=1 Tax=Kerstersia gyiorum TaxID=206506 RepID=A0A4Q7MLN6_9BURK|nr:VOC family protein [Kerstersia gyiorum]KAB0543024.1 VOC family protein [Kerstersia gyiorum]RZS67519.1 glyoxylase I family protein [Kerstersia gyiorum]